MCALHEHNCMPANQNSALLNMALMQSLNCVPDSTQSEVPNVKKIESQPSALNCTTPSLDSHFPQPSNAKSSLYMSKACKYSFIASDYTTTEGQKMLSIKVYQKPIHAEDSSGSKGKNLLCKRSISEYFLSKNNNSEKDNQSERGKDNSLLKSWQRTFFKPQVNVPHPIEESSHCDNANTPFLPDSSECNEVTTSRRCSYSKLGNGGDEPAISGTPLDEAPSASAGPPRNYTLNPNINFKVFDIESISDSGEPCDLGSLDAGHYAVDDAWFIPSSRHTFSGADISGSASAAQLSIASSFGDSSLPICKICHTAAKSDDPLISPCRCTGTLRYIHCGCLMKWLEICNKRSRKPPTCELCKYQFHWHKKFKVGQWQFPHCSWQDKILHTVFLISVLIMIGCAVVTVMCFKQHRGTKAEITHLELTQSEIITLICGALFFLAFFLAMYVEIKARNTIYKLVVKFVYLNQQWYIDEYDKKKENVAIDV